MSCEGCGTWDDQGVGATDLQWQPELVVRKAPMDTAPRCLHQRIFARVQRSLIEKPKGSNSTDTLLSLVREQTEMRFLMRAGETKTFLRWSGEVGVAMVNVARCVTGREAPLPTVMGGEE